MLAPELDEFVGQYHGALDELRGNPEPAKLLYSHLDDVSPPIRSAPL